MAKRLWGFVKGSEVLADDATPAAETVFGQIVFVKQYIRYDIKEGTGV